MQQYDFSQIKDRNDGCSLLNITDMQMIISKPLNRFVRNDLKY